MSNAIRRKTVTSGRIYDENARRYIWYPVHDLDFMATQHSSPIWCPKIPKGRITLLESFPYVTQVVDESEQAVGANGVTLGEKIMGTDAQVRYIMGHSESGYMVKGAKEFDAMIDLDPDSAVEVEYMILGDEPKIPDTLPKFDALLKGVEIDPMHPLASIATSVVADMRNGIQTAINFCRVHTANLEKELREGQSGKPGIKSLQPAQEFWFNAIERPLPEDKAGVNMGNQLAVALRQVLGNQAGADTGSDFEKDLELQNMRDKMAALEAQNKELEKTVEEQNELLAAE